MAPRGNVIAEARFDGKLRTYLVLQGVVAFVASIVGIVALPFWIVLGRKWANRYYDAMSCVLTDRALVLKKGVWFRSESTVPLDRIQDVAVKHGPFLDWLGLATMRVETAGMSAGQASGINLTGVVDTVGFRDLVLEARDRASGWDDDARPALEGAGAATGEAGDGAAAGGAAAGGVALAPGADAATAELLGDIRDTLGRIEALLQRERG